jgi:hypothetical protein
MGFLNLNENEKQRLSVVPNVGYKKEMPSGRTGERRFDLDNDEVWARR